MSTSQSGTIAAGLRAGHGRRLFPGRGFGPVARNDFEPAWVEIRNWRTEKRLEDELAGMVSGAPYEGPGRRPDRAAAMIWAMTELMATPAAQQQIRRL